MHSQQVKRTVIMTSCGFSNLKVAVTGPSHQVAVQGCGCGRLAKLSQASTHPMQPTGFGSELQPLIAVGLGCCLVPPPPQRSSEMPSSLLKKRSWLSGCSGLTEAVPHQVKAVGVETQGCQAGQGIHSHKHASQSSIYGRKASSAHSRTGSLTPTLTSSWMFGALNGKKGLSVDQLMQTW